MNVFVLITLKLLTIANYFLLNIAENENFSAYNHENASFVGIFRFISRKYLMLSGVEHEKNYNSGARLRN